MHLAAVAGNDGRLSAYDPIGVLHDVKGIDAAIVLALAVDGRVSQRDRLDAMLGAVEAAKVLADQLGARVKRCRGWEVSKGSRCLFVDQAGRGIAVDRN